jgi:hypothetical protein
MDAVKMAAYFCPSKPVPKEDKEAASSAHAQPSRLAAAKDTRVITRSSPIVDDTSIPETTAVSRAAALRARLQAVKRQTNLMKDKE